MYVFIWRLAFAVNAILNDLLSLCTYSADHDDEEDEDGDVESSQDRAFFVADQDVFEESSQSFYRQQDAASLQTDVESVEPYFPLAFAESADRPLASRLVSARQPVVAKAHSASRFAGGGVQRSFVRQRCQRYQLLHRETGKRVERYASCRWSNWAGKSQTHPPKGEQVGTLSPSQRTFDRGSNQRTSAVWRQFKPRSHGQERCLETLVKSYFLFWGGGGLFPRTGDILFLLFPIYWRFSRKYTELITFSFFCLVILQSYVHRFVSEWRGQVVIEQTRLVST